MNTKEAVAIVPNVLKKIREYKENGDEIIFTRDTHFENYLETTWKLLILAECGIIIDVIKILKVNGE